MFQNNEIWKDIKGYEGLYQVSNMGMVKSLERIITRRDGSKRIVRERILKQKTKTNGYLEVTLCNGSGKKTFLVHRLVCEGFHKNPKNKPEVNHINEDKSDNRACNLEWNTRKENCNYGTRNAKSAKTRSKPVGQYTREGQLLKIWQSTIEVQRQLGFAQGEISAVALGKRKTAHGYVWKYV